MSDIGSWLEQNGLGKYADVFVENEIELDDLADLTDEDLRELGLPMGPRKRLLRTVTDGDAQSDAVSGTADSRKEESIQPSASGGEAERRQLTVMFCDLVGSTALSESMDPEDYRELLSAYQTAATGAIRGHGGYIARYMGDGLLVYFGYPVAQENDPERAARAGLAVIDAVTALDSPVPLEVRVGIATGPVVVGDIVGEGASEEAAVLGETPNLAARLQGAAAPDTVLLSPTTQQLIHGRVESEALAPIELKGLSKPIVPYRATRPRSLPEVDETRQDSTPLVGRDVEIALLERAWQHAQLSEGHAVLLSGEAGVGKSRLVRTLREAIKEEKHARVQWHCSPYHQTTANYPFIEQLKWAVGVEERSPSEYLDGLESMVDALGLDNRTLVPSLALLLTLPLGERYTLPRWSPDELKRQLTAAQVQLLLASAKQAPVLFIIEDLHWADPTTLEVLGEIIEAIRDAPVLMLLTARPEFNPSWAEQAHAMTQRLAKLSRNETVALVQGIIEEHGLSPDLIAQIVERTDGVPLFVEELTKNLLESASDASVPASLRDSLMARLDRLGPSKELAQTASVIGRIFSVDTLSAIAKESQQAVAVGLESLRATGLVHRRRGVGTEYEFKHALVRDAAYESLLKERRKELHGRAAKALKESAPSELLAYHLTEANEWRSAAGSWYLAGITAATRSSHFEALDHFRLGLKCLRSAEGSHAELALDFYLRMAASYRLLGQPRDVLSTLRESEPLLANHGTDLDKSTAHYLKGVAHFVLGNVDEMKPEEEKALALAREATSPEHEARALSSLGDWAYAKGRVQTAYDYQQQCAILAREHELRVVEVDNLTCLEATTRLIEGSHDVSLAISGIELAHQENQPRAESILCAGVSWAFANRNEPSEALMYAERGIGAAGRVGSRMWKAYTMAAKARALGMLDEYVEALRIAEDAASIARTTGTAIVGGISFGTVAIVARDVETIEAALTEGEAILSEGDAAHCQIDFFRDAIEASLRLRAWERVQHYIGELQRYTSIEPLATTEFHIARGNALIHSGKGELSVSLEQELRRLSREAQRLGFHYYDRHLKSALAKQCLPRP